MKRSFWIALLVLSALLNAAWLHDLAGDHEHEPDDPPAIVQGVNPGPVSAFVLEAPALPVPLLVLLVPEPTPVRFSPPERTLPLPRAPALRPQAPPRAPPFA